MQKNHPRGIVDSEATLLMFPSMIDAVKDYAILMLDPDGFVITWNKGAQLIKGYTADEIIGHHVSQFYRPEESEKPTHELAIAVAQGRCEDEGFRGRKDGTFFWASVVISALKDDHGKLLGFIKVTRDLTERKRAETELLAALAQKHALLQEVHHRVKNNLQIISSLLSLQAARIEDEHAREVFRDSQSRVRSIALLHESLYQSEDLGRIDMAVYFEKLANALTRTYASTLPSLRVVTQLEHAFLNVDTAVPCGLIVNELFTNALKHAFTASSATPEIRLELRAKDDATLFLSVSDNGIGLPDKADPLKPVTLGLTLVKTLSRQIRASFQFESSSGTRCSLEIPRGGSTPPNQPAPA